jgi:hypothetical protein
VIIDRDVRGPLQTACREQPSLDNHGSYQYNIGMKTVERPKRKPGPSRSSVATQQYTVMLEPAVAEWAKTQPGGLSALVRRLLRNAQTLTPPPDMRTPEERIEARRGLAEEIGKMGLPQLRDDAFDSENIY